MHQHLSIRLGQQLTLGNIGHGKEFCGLEENLPQLRTNLCKCTICDLTNNSDDVHEGGV